MRFIRTVPTTQVFKKDQHFKNGALKMGIFEEKMLFDLENFPFPTVRTI